MIVRQLREAEAELFDAAARYEAEDPGLGIRFLDAVYLLVRDVLWIVAFAHTSRLPGYWSSRLRQVP